jgi:hypothetical protein
MSYLSTQDVQTWLQNTKYKISSVEEGFESAAVAYTFAEVAQRYDTSTWLNSASTPQLILTLLSMQVAAYELRRAAGEEDGRTTYADALDSRASAMCSAIVSGAVILPGAVVSDTGALGLGPSFFPDFGADQRDPMDDTFAPLYFTMKHEF